MARARFALIDDYIAAQPAAHRAALERVRSIIAATVPEAEETISYAIPAFRLNGRILIYFAGFRNHFSIYPASDDMVAAFFGELDRYRVSKGTLRFPYSEPVSAPLIERIVAHRAAQVRAMKKATTR